jgi:hydroxypyruvate isomerase
MKSSVCIEMIFTEYPFLERVKKAGEAGFDAIEFWNWDDKDLPAIKAAIEKAGLGIASFQSNLGGTLIHPEHRAGFVAGIKKSLGKAREMGSSCLFMLTDELGEDRSVRFQFPELSQEAKYQSVLDGLKTIAPLAEEAGVTLVLEPLNIYVDHPGYFLHGSAAGFDLVRAVGSPRIKLLYDVYHMQVMEGNVTQTLIGNLDLIGHLHVADVPGRHQPGTGELNYANIFAALRRAGYDRYVGFEFEPTVPSEKAAATSLALLTGQ